MKVVEEGAFQTDIGPGDRVFWLTDLGWIMGPWLLTAGLGNGATVLLYDGAPDHPGPDRLWAFVAGQRATHCGVSPTLVRALMAHGDDRARRPTTCPGCACWRRPASRGTRTRGAGTRSGSAAAAAR